jgi:cytochrome c biogenesis protein CcmG/thiol:disulfide interchange protein DsbE
MTDMGSTPPSPETATPPAHKGGRLTIFGMTISAGTLLAWTVLLALLALLAFGLLRQQRGPVQVGQQATDFSLTAFSGEQIRLQELRGKVVLINFWASWCIPCEDEAGYLETAWQSYKPRGDVIFLGIDYADTEREALAFLEEFSVTYPNAPDLGTRVSQSYRITGVPETYVIGPDGKLASFRLFPFSSVAEIKAMIEPLLEE